MPRNPKKSQPKTQKEKRELATALLLKEPALPNRVIARNCNMSHSTIGIIRQELIKDGRIDQMRTIENTFLDHEYIKANAHILDKLNDKTLRALKSPGTLDMMESRSLTNPAYAQRLVRKERLAAEEAKYDKLTESDVIVKCDNVYDGFPWIADEAIDSVIVDPPYNDVNVHKAIAAVATRVLKPGGLLVILTGQSHFNKIVKVIDEVPGLVYHWLGSYLTLHGGSTALQYLGVAPYHKPILIYIKGKRVWKRPMFSDVINTKPDAERQTRHRWEQDRLGTLELVRRFSSVGETVLDCVCGSSTTGAACVELKRKYIGVDIDPESVRISKERLLAMLKDVPNLPE